jgi:hypothetical protein
MSNVRRLMNSRRVHELMRQHFPVFSSSERDWMNIAGTSGADPAKVQEFLERHIVEPELLIQVNRKLGAVLSGSEAVAFVCAHIGEGQIQIANREFTSFVVVAQNGVATGWRASATPG